MQVGIVMQIQEFFPQVLTLLDLVRAGLKDLESTAMASYLVILLQATLPVLITVGVMMLIQECSDTEAIKSVLVQMVQSDFGSITMVS
jgi:hypothetical protein